MANQADLKIKLEVYAAAIAAILETGDVSSDAAFDPENTTANIPEADVLAVLVARDELEYLLNQADFQPSVPEILTITELDDRLAQHQRLFLNSIDIAQFHKLLHPPESHWWWFMSSVPYPEEETGIWDRFDWVFDSLTLVFLAGFTALATQVIPIIFSNGLSVLESIGFLGPGALLTIIGSNFRGGESRDKFIQGMAKLGVPAKFCSEITCLLALILFSGALVARRSLPKIYFDSLFQDGVTSYKQSRLIPAQESLNAALKLPDLNPKEVGQVFNYLGLIEESMGHNDKAIENYDRAISLGDMSSINNVSRVYIAKGDLLTAETYLKIGLQRIQDSEESRSEDSKIKILQYSLHRNLGWAYLEGKRYKEAEGELETARKITDKYLKDADFLGRGMASCFLAVVYEQTGRSQQSLPIWQRCRERGKPETISEYRAIVKFKPELGSYIDTKGIF